MIRLAPTDAGILWLPPGIAWKMATSDPARARRLVDEAQRYDDRPQDYFFLALGLKARDPAAADEACRKAIAGFDRQMREGAALFHPSGEVAATLSCLLSSRSIQPWCPSCSGVRLPRGHRPAIRVCSPVVL